VVAKRNYLNNKVVETRSGEFTVGPWLWKQINITEEKVKCELRGRT
jgi:hypothetical protein